MEIEEEVAFGSNWEYPSAGWRNKLLPAAQKEKVPRDKTPGGITSASLSSASQAFLVAGNGRGMGGTGTRSGSLDVGEKKRKNFAAMKLLKTNVSTCSTASSSIEMQDDKLRSYKIQKQAYRSEKKRVAKELVQALKDPTVVVMADWLKIRGTLRKWTRLYCVLKPGLLLIYKSAKTHKYGYWVGTVLLSSCELIERPSKKDGFCFKLFHPLDQSIWATRGPRGESLGAVTLPLPGSYLICRALSEEAGRCWLDALELALRCSSLLMRTMNNLQGGSTPNLETVNGQTVELRGTRSGSMAEDSPRLNSSSQEDVTIGDQSTFHDAKDLEINESEAERHFFEDLEAEGEGGGSDSDETGDMGDFRETSYEESEPEQFGALGDAEQTEDIPEENKSLMWTLMKQVRPGMDLSKVVLPTFILEPRSFLEKLADYYYHSDLVTKAIQEDDPFRRMKTMVKFYLSGFYKKPKGLKKPYNPILGERFRCYWQHNDQGRSKTFYVAEQVSHHPPVSAFHVSNRQAGFNVCGTILAKSKFYGNSLSAIMVGNARITLLSRGENYVVSLPYAHCKGLILGTLTMEFGGQVSIVCDRTSYTTELDFKLKPFLGGADSMNAITGKIKLGRETLADIDGHWDGPVHITDRQSGEKELLWQPTQDVIKTRLKRFEVPLTEQEDFESQYMWRKVTEAIGECDQVKATEEKTVLEEAQRKRAKDLRDTNQTHEPHLFHYEPTSGHWLYKHADYRPWDLKNDLTQTEGGFIVRSVARHKTPLVRSGSLSSGLTVPPGPEVEGGMGPDSSDEEEDIWGDSRRRKRGKDGAGVSREEVEELLKPLETTLNSANLKISGVQRTLGQRDGRGSIFHQGLILVAIFLAAQAILFKLFLR